MELSYLEKRNQMKLNGKPVAEKKRYKIPPKSAKKIAAEKKEREERKNIDSNLEKWFKARRKELTGMCKCGCGNSSSKHDDDHFRASCCHILPKAIFESVALHPLNCIELNFWDGCHTNFDTMGLDRWPNMQCWNEIRIKVTAMDNLLTKEEKAHKFYKQLNALIQCHS